ncbi:MAG: histidine triad nucleotide-binding protein [Acidobacteria bacterium]|nr:histidine triad nucleotide-binding protein [Acidobacteriota bacterium]MCI0620112.1 histidine triad nucleotide-binding protein [Acidobacteriota bacterium]MCI0720897.1 histidine triad nucleotide-binding protein [Acidobacteriota bacterium]
MSDCLFCKFVRKEIPTRVVFEDDSCLAFEDINPKAPVHVLVIPKKHVASINVMTMEDEAVLGHLAFAARQIALEKKIDQSGYRAVFNTGPDAGQSVFHIHLHLLGGRPLAWPPG